MKLNVTFVFRTINSIKLQRIHFYIIDIYVGGNEGVKNAWQQKSLRIFKKKWNNPAIRPDATENRDEFENSREIFNAENRTETSEVKDISRKSFQKKMKTNLFFTNGYYIHFPYIHFRNFRLKRLKNG